jgi:cobalt/nickel transport system permease protein
LITTSESFVARGPGPNWNTALKNSRSFLEKTLARFASILEESIFAEETASRKGWLQDIDPRIKIAGFLLMLLGSAFSHSLLVICGLYVFSLILAFGSRVFSASYVARVWIFMPFYTMVIALPAIFLTPGNTIYEIPGISLAITEQGLRSATFLITRVATSVSFMLLLVLTTPWPSLLKGMRSLGFPKILVFLLMMTYRYLHVLLSTASSLFLGRKSRKVGPEEWQNTRAWMGMISSALLAKSFHLSNEVHLAMQSRGFRGEPVVMNDFRLRGSDFAWLILFCIAAFGAFYFGRWRVV